MSEPVNKKEIIHDDEISPLVDQIIEICKKHDIDFLTSFALLDDGDDDQLRCTTSVIKNNDRKLIAATDIIMGKNFFAALRVIGND